MTRNVSLVVATKPASQLRRPVIQRSKSGSYCTTNDYEKTSQKRPVLVILTTVPFTLNTFFRGQLAYLSDAGFEVHAIASSGQEWPEIVDRERVKTHQVEMTRTGFSASDFESLLRLVRLFRTLRPDIVHTFTPKGGLIGLAAALLARVPVRCNTIFGFVFASRQGGRRRIMRFFESLSCRLATNVYAECGSIADLAVQEGVCSFQKLSVLPAWSLHSVRTQLDASERKQELRRCTRAELNIPQNAFVFGYIGRLVPEKGIRELIASFGQMANRTDLRLLLVGPQESEHPLPVQTWEQIIQDPRIYSLGFQKDISRFLAAMDVLVHPSYREGLSSAPLEALAMAVPVITTDVPGCRDAVRHGFSGLLVPPADPAALRGAMDTLRSDPQLCMRLGVQAQTWVEETINLDNLWERLAADYRSMLTNDGEQSA